MATTLNRVSLSYRIRRVKADAWTLGGIALSALILLPVAAVLYLALNPTENIWPHLWRTSLPQYVKNSLLLMLGVGITVCCMGVRLKLTGLGEH